MCLWIWRDCEARRVGALENHQGIAYKLFNLLQLWSGLVQLLVLLHLLLLNCPHLAVKNDWIAAKELAPGWASIAIEGFFIATAASCSPSVTTHFLLHSENICSTDADKNSLGSWRGFWLSNRPKIKVGNGNFWFIFILNLWLTIKSKKIWPNYTGAPVPIS